MKIKFEEMLQRTVSLQAVSDLYHGSTASCLQQLWLLTSSDALPSPSTIRKLHGHLKERIFKRSMHLLSLIFLFRYHARPSGGLELAIEPADNSQLKEVQAFEDANDALAAVPVELLLRCQTKTLEDVFLAAANDIAKEANLVAGIRRLSVGDFRWRIGV